MNVINGGSLLFLQLVAKLKAVFDRFDDEKSGFLTGVKVEQALLYMNRAIDSEPVRMIFHI
jgi:hypothetical protein